ncbi:MAG: hypothetical protein K0Q99_336 [Clostridia bacterium]|jgi:hypothetical protein|nr:hypothetical protein [Clostridia bacterium]
MNKYEYEHTNHSEMIVTTEVQIPVMPKEFELATAYVPYQVMQKIFEPKKALMKGTIFPELYRPYVKQKHDR